MPFLRPRFTVRRLMIAVAIVAVVLWSIQTRRRWLTYTDRHEEYSIAETHYLESADEPFRGCGMVRLTPEERREMDVIQKKWSLAQATHFGRLKRKYARAMGRPWLPVPPDPPEPE